MHFMRVTADRLNTTEEKIRELEEIAVETMKH